MVEGPDASKLQELVLFGPQTMALQRWQCGFETNCCFFFFPKCVTSHVHEPSSFAFPLL